ncbi:MAG: hypothetical protein JNK65_07070, partial [Deltaproteobacteria bacterium]|nr:hypothetical protein [Deltaproteobacteria bacterium]
PFDLTLFLTLFQMGPTSQTERFLKDISDRKILIRWVNSATFHTLAAELSSRDTDLCFLRVIDEKSTPEIIMKAPEVFSRDEKGVIRAQHEIKRRMKGALHEWEHYKQYSGSYAKLEAPLQRIAKMKNTREGRLATEMMGYFEEYRWAVLHTDNTIEEIAKRMGMNVSLYYKHLADYSYFSKSDLEKMNDLLEVE